MTYMISDAQMYDHIVADIRQAAGVYVLRCLRGNADTDERRRVNKLLGIDNPGMLYIPVNRLVRVDYSGILYIGMGVPVCDRAGHLRAALCAAAGGQQEYTDVTAHGVGPRYIGAAQALYPFDRLCLTIEAVSAGKNPGDLESQMLTVYREQYGELPPFNLKRPQ